MVGCRIHESMKGCLGWGELQRPWMSAARLGWVNECLCRDELPGPWMMIWVGASCRVNEGVWVEANFRIHEWVSGWGDYQGLWMSGRARRVAGCMTECLPGCATRSMNKCRGWGEWMGACGGGVGVGGELGGPCMSACVSCRVHECLDGNELQGPWMCAWGGASCKVRECLVWFAWMSAWVGVREWVSLYGWVAGSTNVCLCWGELQGPCMNRWARVRSRDHKCELWGPWIVACMMGVSRSVKEYLCVRSCRVHEWVGGVSIRVHECVWVGVSCKMSG